MKRELLALELHLDRRWRQLRRPSKCQLPRIVDRPCLRSTVKRGAMGEIWTGEGEGRHGWVSRIRGVSCRGQRQEAGEMGSVSCQ